MGEQAPAQGGGPELLELLAKTPLFSGLSEQHLARLVAIGLEESFARNAFIFREGDVGDKFYLVLSGAVRISRQVSGMGEEALTVLRPGAAFGEMALIEDAPRSADALAHERCRLFALHKGDLEDLLFVDRALAHDLLWKLVRILSGRLRDTTDKMMFLSFAGKFE